MSDSLGADPRTGDEVHVIDLSIAPGERQAWTKPTWVIYIWAAVELLVVTNPWQISSRVRVGALRIFGASIGSNVVFRPRARVKSPWNLSIGNNSWIGEGVWFHNQDRISIGANVVISQETMLTTGSHRYKSDMGLITKPIVVEDGVWITSRCMVLGGRRIGRSSLIAPMSVVDHDVPSNSVYVGRAEEMRRRFDKDDEN